MGQITVLFEHYCKRESKKIEIEAAMHGAKISKNTNKEPKRNFCMFEDPEVYKTMSDEEKKELTNKMMNAHRGLVQAKISNMGS